MATKKNTDETENTVEAAAETDAVDTTEVKAVAPAEAPKKRAKAATSVAEKVADGAAEGADTTAKQGKRAEKIGVVTSDKMMLTVVVRVDRLVKHPIYRKYIRKRKK